MINAKPFTDDNLFNCSSKIIANVKSCSIIRTSELKGLSRINLEADFLI